jgi:hypothetical protein
MVSIRVSQKFHLGGDTYEETNFFQRKSRRLLYHICNIIDDTAVKIQLKFN